MTNQASETTTAKVVIKTNSKAKRIAFNTAWFFSALTFCIIFLSLWSYSPSDPAWSRSREVFDVENSMGKFGAYLADILYYIFGYSSYWISVLFGVLFVDMWHRANGSKTNAKRYEFDIFNAFSFLVLLLASSVFASKILNVDADYLPCGGGGLVGTLIAEQITKIFGFIGSALVLFGIICISLSSFLEFSWLGLSEKIGKIVCSIWEHGKAQRKAKQIKKIEEQKKQAEANSGNGANTQSTPSKPEIVHKEQSKHGNIVPKKIFSHLPKLDVWKDETKSYPIGEESLTFTSRVIEHRLNAFGLEVRVVSVNAGPVVTLFELQLPNGVRSSQLVSLSRDIARELAVAHVRIIQNVPGKNTVGLELPNNLRQNIYMRQLIMGLLAKQEDGLHIALGVKADSQPLYTDLSKMPHCLIAGTTGSGKSVVLHSIITSLLAKMLPQELRLVLIDPKMLEMTAYRNIPHLLTPIITDTPTSNKTLEWLVKEMENRYAKMSEYMVRHITIYNQKIKDKEWVVKNKIQDITPMPYIVVIIDELADLMLSSGKSIEINIVRLAQKARASGIHLVLATQRPTADVVTGLIKANVPSRLALQVASKLDSRLILDQNGAEGLLGKGDMLFLESGNPNPIRIHGVWIDDEEITAMAQFWRDQGAPNYVQIDDEDEIVAK
ncbi:MAG: putative cell division protein [Pseudomonadota bacterium]|jgi:S-DNA-T family DNA segregation ATPase FtsK/SpoIIIE